MAIRHPMRLQEKRPRQDSFHLSANLRQIYTARLCECRASQRIYLCTPVFGTYALLRPPTTLPLLYTSHTVHPSFRQVDACQVNSVCHLEMTMSLYRRLRVRLKQEAGEYIKTRVRVEEVLGDVRSEGFCVLIRRRIKGVGSTGTTQFLELF